MNQTSAFKSPKTVSETLLIFDITCIGTSYKCLNSSVFLIGMQS